MATIGYRRVPTSDPEEERLRTLFYSAPSASARQVASEQLAAYLWKRVEAEVAADRKKHPKKKRNLSYDGSISAIGATRSLP